MKQIALNLLLKKKKVSFCEGVERNSWNNSSVFASDYYWEYFDWFGGYVTVDTIWNYSRMGWGVQKVQIQLGAAILRVMPFGLSIYMASSPEFKFST